MSRVSLHWTPHWGMVVLVLILVPLTVSLGFWQLQRADEKRTLLAEHEARSVQPPLDISTGLPPADEHLRYREVTLAATIDNERVFLLDNRPRRGQQGYEVHVLATALNRDGSPTGFHILVNRGWIGTGLDRRQLPLIPAVAGQVRLRGYLYQPPSAAIVLAADAWADNDWPLVVQSVDPERMAQHLGVDLSSYTLRLAPADLAALEADWPIVIDGPAKHLGYAVQWFSMAAVLLLLAVFANSNLWQVLTSGTHAADEDKK